MGQDLPRPGNDGRGRRPLGSSRHHLRDERRELPPPRRTRTQARPRPPASPRDNHGQRLIAAPLHLKPQFRLRDNHAATIMPMPRHRIPILIAAPFPSRSPPYTLKRKAAPGVDGMTWQDYEADLELRIEDLHGRVHRGAYRPQPSRRAYIDKADGNNGR